MELTFIPGVQPLPTVSAEPKVAIMTLSVTVVSDELTELTNLSLPRTTHSLGTEPLLLLHPEAALPPPLTGEAGQQVPLLAPVQVPRQHLLVVLNKLKPLAFSAVLGSTPCSILGRVGLLPSAEVVPPVPDSVPPSTLYAGLTS